MNKEKQIEEMAKALTAYEKKLCDRLPKDKCLLTSAVHAQVSCDYCKIAEFLVNAGYRKIYDDHQRQCTYYALGCQMAEQLKREVAEEIFAEIEKQTKFFRDYMPLNHSCKVIIGVLDKLKEKYIGEDINVTTKESEKDNG